LDPLLNASADESLSANFENINNIMLTVPIQESVTDLLRSNHCAKRALPSA
jgi:hypothetical protein